MSSRNSQFYRENVAFIRRSIAMGNTLSQCQRAFIYYHDLKDIPLNVDVSAWGADTPKELCDWYPYFSYFQTEIEEKNPTLLTQCINWQIEGVLGSNYHLNIDTIPANHPCWDTIDVKTFTTMNHREHARMADLFRPHLFFQALEKGNAYFGSMLQNSEIRLAVAKAMLENPTTISCLRLILNIDRNFFEIPSTDIVSNVYKKLLTMMPSNMLDKKSYDHIYKAMTNTDILEHIDDMIENNKAIRNLPAEFFGDARIARHIIFAELRAYKGDGSLWAPEVRHDFGVIAGLRGSNIKEPIVHDKDFQMGLSKGQFLKITGLTEQMYVQTKLYGANHAFMINEFDIL